MAVTPGIDSAAARSDLVGGALSVARRAHAGQIRDGRADMPFIEHPLAVAERLSEQGSNDEVLAAALLHDVVEHTEVEPAEVRERFGGTVAELVDALTEDQALKPYEARKEEHRRRVAEAGPEALAIFAADRLANVEALRDVYSLEGEDADEGLTVSLDLKIYLWELDLEMLFDEAPGLALVDLLADELARLWGERAAELRACSD
jgi:GTP diphosphokinase / guanosine-3',5'-bis(diphosphate) 3'-diphosphatase